MSSPWQEKEVLGPQFQTSRLPEGECKGRDCRLHRVAKQIRVAFTQGAIEGDWEIWWWPLGLIY
jgi:hypothetical protein